MLKTQPKPPPTPGGQIRNSKLRGEWAELRFMTRVAEHGVMISKPWGDSARYDLMIEHHGRVLRIQVKSTMRIVRGCYRCHLPTLSRCHNPPAQRDGTSEVCSKRHWTQLRKHPLALCRIHLV